MVVGLLLVLEGKTTVRDVVEVLQPLKEGDSDTTSVDVQVRNDKHILLNEDAIGSRGRWSIRSLCNDLKTTQNSYC